MNTDVVNTEGKSFALSVEEKIIVREDKNSEVIWEKKQELAAQRFTISDLWFIRMKAKRFKVY